ncbi:phage tail tip lysozyme [Lactiplantibacillus plantarum]|uniref:phage tail tip lysozyme n=1 Tax=Lactiplantibacillus plantarum TaxID=1590 RepID=UPI0020015C2F|nr:phage tail tip lysozyme [Lactiplantibacillus plantarum]
MKWKSLRLVVIAFLASLTLFAASPFRSVEVVAQASNTAIFDTQFDNCVADSGNSSSGGDSNQSTGKDDTSQPFSTTNLKEVYKELNGKWGMSAAAIAGIVGNWTQESGLSPKSINGIVGRVPTHAELEAQFSKGTGGHSVDNGSGYGQWTYERHDALMAMAAKQNNKVWWETDIQMEYMATGDGANIDLLRKYAQNATDNIANNVSSFQTAWERTSDGSMGAREKFGEKVYSYMKSNGMDDKGDSTKLSKLTSGGKDTGASSSDLTDASKTTDDCSTDTKNDVGGSAKPGKESVAPNGKSGQVIGSWDLDSLPANYKSAIKLPAFKAPDWSKDPFNAGGNQGQCTDFTYNYMTQLWSGTQPTLGNGGDVWNSYKSGGAKITDKPTVGYGMSATDGHLWASGAAGHTGVVVAVFSDGKFLVEQFNVHPHPAPSRVPMFTLIDGVSSNASWIHFFSGVGKAK